MTQKRVGASSVLDGNGDMWVLGGSANSSASDSTEVYDFKPSKKDLNVKKTKCDQVCQLQTPDNPACCSLVPDIEAKDAGRWRKGFPLPNILRDTGISNNCAVRINSTHVFMAGGYAREYDAYDAVKDSKVDGKWKSCKMNIL